MSAGAELAMLIVYLAFERTEEQADGFFCPHGRQPAGVRAPPPTQRWPAFDGTEALRKRAPGPVSQPLLPAQEGT